MHLPVFRPLAGAALLVTLTLGGILPGEAVNAASSTGALRIVSVGRAPSAIAVDTPLSRAYVVNSGDASVSILDTRSGALLRTVSLAPVSPKQDSDYEIAVDARAGRVVVVSDQHPPARGRVTVLDARTGSVVRTTDVGVFPRWEVVSEPAHRVFVSNLDSNTVSVLDSRTGAVLRTVPTGSGPAAMTVDDRTGRVFVANSDGTVTILSAFTGALLHTVLTGQGNNGFAYIASGSLSRVFAFNPNGRMTVIDGASGVRLRTLTLGTLPGGTVVNPVTGRVFATLSGINMSGHLVAVLDARTGVRLRTIAVGRGPLGVVLDRTTQCAFVANYAGNSVSVLDARTYTVRRTVPAAGPFALAVDEGTHRVLVANFSSPRTRGSVTILDSRG